MGLSEQELNKLTADVLKPDFVDLPFIIPKHYFNNGNGHDVTKTIMDTDNLAYKIHYMEDVGNPYHTTWLYIGRHFNYEKMVDDNWDNWNLTDDVINAPIESGYSNCISDKTGAYCEKLAIWNLGKESQSIFDELDNAMVYENGDRVRNITKHMISRTSSYVKGLIRSYK